MLAPVFGGFPGDSAIWYIKVISTNMPITPFRVKPDLTNLQGSCYPDQSQTSLAVSAGFGHPGQKPSLEIQITCDVSPTQGAASGGPVA